MKKRREILDKLGITITKESIKNQAMDKKQMLERRNPYEINKWIADTYGISANEMIDSIIETGDILQIYEFFYLIVDIRKEFGNYNSLKDLGIHDEKIKKLEKAILDSKNAKLIRYCIGFVPGIDLDKYLKSLYDTKSLWDIQELSEGKDYTDKDEVANPELIDRVELDEYKKAKEEAEKYSQRGEYFPNSLEDYKKHKDDINVLIEKVIETKSPYLICELANYIEHLPSTIIKDKNKQTTLRMLTEAELATCDAMGIYEFLSSVQAIPKDLFYNMVQKIIEIDDEKYIRYTLEFTPYKERVQEDNERDILWDAFIRINNREGAKRFIKERERGER